MTNLGDPRNGEIVAKPIDETDDGSREVTSSLRHKITRQLAPDGSKVVTEKRGIRRATWSVPAFGARPKVDTESARVFGLMTMAANRHLRAVGEMDAIAVMETADRLASEYPSAKKISQHMRLWAENIKTQQGVLSIDATAARFLQTADHLLQILDQTPAMQSAAFAFADAWHWWHAELHGEHALAAKAVTAERSVAGLKAGPEALKRNRALREAIIETKYKKHAKTAEKIDRDNPLRAADAILKAVAADFRKQDLGPIQKSTLERALRKIIRERGRD
jgi:hypothetical protein